MPARIVKQNREIKELFRAKIREKVECERKEMHGRINEEVLSWIRWAIRPLAECRLNAVRARNEAKGGRRGGERFPALLATPTEHLDFGQRRRAGIGARRVRPDRPRSHRAARNITG